MLYSVVSERTCYVLLRIFVIEIILIYVNRWFKFPVANKKENLKKEILPKSQFQFYFFY